MTSPRLAFPLLAACLALAACQPGAPSSQDPVAADTDARPSHEREPDELDKDALLAEAGTPHQVVAEAFSSVDVPEDNVDSLASWVAGDGTTWLIATAKEGDHGLVVYDGETGERLRGVGTVGGDLGQFRRPNGIFVHGDYLFVVERDNQRVQVLALPGFEALGSFGEAVLEKPYGLWLRPLPDNTLEVLVTDAYMAGEDAMGEDIVPPVVELDRRIRRFIVTTNAGAVTARHEGAIGDTSEAGAIRIPESLWGDVANDRLLVAEEDEHTGTALREYSLDGRFQGSSHGLGLFGAQAEGIALWACADGSGYWIATDQFKDRSLFHVFDRLDLAYRGAFAGEKTANTDGVWLHQAPTARFPAGVFYAVHDDMGVAAFDWRDVAAALDLRVACGT
ncbi:phytase [Arenimonas soli]|uniref:Phytase n=1 Tax=Arenimonas soli TaxID=2269504 RepID=A0ABQ1HQ93_9GAMM|nr:phytase [Arenimonas soli]GGA85866.1 phytase [Arenimonas soli]